MKRLLVALVLGVAALSFIGVVGRRDSAPLPNDIVADSLVVLKHARKLIVYSSGRAIKSYDIALGHNPEGAKVEEGDGRTPEGTYVISSKTTKSRFHMNLGISYPDSSDASNARQRGVSPGGDIKIHGLRTFLGFIGHFHTFVDWTEGCIAVTNAEIEELYRAVPVGTKITIVI
jgi:murein L,D-transpeptidase YafK